MSELPTGWAWTELDEVCTSITDGDHQPPPQVPAGIPFLVIGNIREQRLNFTNCRYVSPEYFESLKPIRRPRRGDVLYSLVGSYGIPVLVKDDAPFCVQRHIGILRPSPEISAAFLAFILSSHEIFDQATRYATGTAQLTVPLSGLRRIRIPLPPCMEQDRIVAAIEEQLSRLDAGVAALERVRLNLKRMRAAALAELETSAARAAPFRSLAEITEFIVDGDHNPPRRTVPGIPYLTAKHVKRGQISVKGATYISQEDFTRISRRYIPRAGDVLVTCVGTLGEIAIVPEGLTFAADRNLAAMRPGSAVRPRYLEAVLRSPRQQRVLTAGSGSTAQPHLYLRDLRNLIVPLPSIEDQEELLVRLDEQLSIADRLEAEIEASMQRTHGLRLSVLAAAFSGKLVPQDPTDEPGSVLLERIAAERASSNGHKTRRGRKPRVRGEEVTA